MTKQTEALKLALEALEEINKLSIGENAICLPAEIDTAMDAIRKALAEQPAQHQEPVAWAFLNGQYAHIVWGKQRPDDEIHTIPLYTSPPASKPWVGLSTDEIYDMYNEPRSDAEMVEFARAIEAKLREKNA